MVIYRVVSRKGPTSFFKNYKAENNESEWVLYKHKTKYTHIKYSAWPFSLCDSKLFCFSFLYTQLPVHRTQISYNKHFFNIWKLHREGKENSTGIGRVTKNIPFSGPPEKSLPSAVVYFLWSLKCVQFIDMHNVQNNFKTRSWHFVPFFIYCVLMYTV